MNDQKETFCVSSFKLKVSFCSQAFRPHQDIRTGRCSQMSQETMQPSLFSLGWNRHIFNFHQGHNQSSKPHSLLCMNIPSICFCTLKKKNLVFLFFFFYLQSLQNQDGGTGPKVHCILLATLRKKDQSSKPKGLFSLSLWEKGLG